MNLKEFAARIGLSQTTVSRAMSGYPEVRPETRARVLEAAERLGYRPNISAQRLATGRAGAIGIVFRGGGRFGPHSSEFMGGLSTRLQKDGIDILLSTVETEDDEAAAYRRLAASKRVDAVIVHTPACTDDRIVLLRALGLPFILHGRSEAKKPFAYLDIDNFGAIETATRYLAGLGHRRIALINGDTASTYARDRDDGFRAALEVCGLSLDAALTGHGEFTDETGFRLMQAFLALPAPPTAVIAGSMMSALGAMRAIRIAGLTVGRDVSLIAHDDVFPYLSPDNLMPALTTTQSPIRAAGERIGDMVLRMLQGEAVETLQEVWPVEFIVRGSTGPAPA
ncbi:substrate-binding domain-containing protein [Shinella sp. CPCC 101442]|uniref:LacI family DNA-binding transcriptional regulator n=1 Tax=Shinella sp. CPCC 101442 TaxID=2932265 RepID=UPI00215282FF|nr:substrate-binding domain-containing protein [Shinella sp. CPCC 101442]MCR6500392.1 substrate-binding domain-containing protein [Shinella sp. CPCC 101442]